MSVWGSRMVYVGLRCGSLMCSAFGQQWSSRRSWPSSGICIILYLLYHLIIIWRPFTSLMTDLMWSADARIRSKPYQRGMKQQPYMWMNSLLSTGQGSDMSVLNQTPLWGDAVGSLESICGLILSSVYLLAVLGCAQCYCWHAGTSHCQDQPCLAITMIYEVLCNGGGWAVCRRSCYQRPGMCEGLIGFGWRGEEWGDHHSLRQPTSAGSTRSQVVQVTVHGSDWGQSWVRSRADCLIRE